jgi:very-short-patch-repair endonuclease
VAGGERSHLSHESAAELHRIEGLVRGRVVVTVDHPDHIRFEGATFHQLTDVNANHLTSIGGFPVTTPTRTIVDLAAVTGHVRLQSAVEDAVVRRLTTFGQLDRVLREVRRKGKPGVRKLVTVLDRLDGEPPAESVLEELLFRAAERARVRVVRQHPLPSSHPRHGVVDGAVIESRLLLEADGRSWHSREREMARDRQRDREAARAGWQTLRFVHDDLVHDLHGCADDIRETHTRRLRG